MERPLRLYNERFNVIRKTIPLSGAVFHLYNEQFNVMYTKITKAVPSPGAAFAFIT